VSLSTACDRDELYPSLGLARAIFFDRETFGEDRLVPGVPVGRQKADAGAWHAFLARTALSPAVRRDIERIETELIDYMPGLTSEQKKDHLSRISYRDYLLEIAQADPADIGGYTAERSPDRPILVHMVRTPCQPGLSEHDQNRAGRVELLATPFETFERNIREQLGRTLAGGGFDPAHDITAITVNRWPHGYAPEFNPLWSRTCRPISSQT
jgi:hypothetical protein